jgi:hypothetical protein
VASEKKTNKRVYRKINTKKKEKKKEMSGEGFEPATDRAK